MAIKFTFTLNDADAENLFSILNSEKARMLDQVVEEAIADNRPSFKQWYKDYAAYLQRLSERMLTCQSNEPDSESLTLEEPKQPPQESPGEPLWE